MSWDPIVVLLSAGRHPVSGRLRRATCDARALSAALATGLPVVGLHAGEPGDFLRDYLGMGPIRAISLDIPDHGDPIPALVACLSRLAPRLVMAGARAETGEGSGLVPYLVAHALHLPVVPAIISLEVRGERADILQALPGARRRRLSAVGPLVATVDEHGPPLRQIAHARARRAIIERAQPLPSELPSVTGQSLMPPSTDRPARPRPRRIGPAMAADAGGGRRLLAGPEATLAASEILRFLEANMLLAFPHQPAGTTKEPA